MKAKSKIIYDSELNPRFYKTLTEVDLSDLFDPDLKKKLTSIRIDINGLTYWKAVHHVKGVYWTTNENDPKILNTSAVDQNGKVSPRPRGNIRYATGEVGRASGGRKHGSVNRQSVAMACANVNVQPAEFLAAVVAGNVGVLKKYKVKDAHNIPLTLKVKVAETLLHKLQGNARPIDVDDYGERMRLDGDQDKSKPQIQIYIPSQGATATLSVDDKDAQEIQENGLEAYLESHKHELDIPEIEDNQELVWEIGDDREQ